MAHQACTEEHFRLHKLTLTPEEQRYISRGVVILNEPQGRRYRFSRCDEHVSDSGQHTMEYSQEDIALAQDAYYEAHSDPTLAHPSRQGTPEPQGQVLELPETVARSTRADTDPSHTEGGSSAPETLALMPIKGESMHLGMRTLGLPRAHQTDRGADTKMHLGKAPIIPTTVVEILRPGYASSSALKTEGDRSSGPEHQRSRDSTNEKSPNIDAIGSAESVVGSWWDRQDQMIVKPRNLPQNQCFSTSDEYHSENTLSSSDEDYSENEVSGGKPTLHMTSPMPGSPAHDKLLTKRWAQLHKTKIRPKLLRSLGHLRGTPPRSEPKMAKRPEIQRIITPQRIFFVARGDTWDAFDAVGYGSIRTVTSTPPHPRQCTRLPSTLSPEPISRMQPFNTEDILGSDPRIRPRATTVRIEDCSKIRVQIPMTPHEKIETGVRETWIVIIGIILQNGFLWTGGPLAPYIRAVCLERFVKVQYFETDTKEEGLLLRDTLDGFMLRREDGSHAWQPESKKGAPVTGEWDDLPLNVAEGIFPARRRHGLYWRHQIVTGYTGKPGPNEVRLPAVNPPWMIDVLPPTVSGEAKYVAEAYIETRYQFPLVKRLAMTCRPMFLGDTPHFHARVPENGSPLFPLVTHCPIPRTTSGNCIIANLGGAYGVLYNTRPPTHQTSEYDTTNGLPQNPFWTQAFTVLVCKNHRASPGDLGTHKIKT